MPGFTASNSCQRVPSPKFRSASFHSESPGFTNTLPAIRPGPRTASVHAGLTGFAGCEGIATIAPFGAKAGLEGPNGLTRGALGIPAVAAGNFGRNVMLIAGRVGRDLLANDSAFFGASITNGCVSSGRSNGDLRDGTNFFGESSTRGGFGPTDSTVNPAGADILGATGATGDASDGSPTGK